MYFYQVNDNYYINLDRIVWFQIYETESKKYEIQFGNNYDNERHMSIGGFDTETEAIKYIRKYQKIIENNKKNDIDVDIVKINSELIEIKSKLKELEDTILYQPNGEKYQEAKEDFNAHLLGEKYIDK